MRLRRLSLLWKIWLSTSVALTLLFMLTGYMLQREVLAATSRSLDVEVKESFQAYESVWKARAEMLASVAGILSSMPNVRAAFGTRDPATIHDSAGEVWTTLSESLKETAFFLVTDPEGSTITSLNPVLGSDVPGSWPVVGMVRSRFPKQVSGFVVSGNSLFQVILTPVYVDAGPGHATALINILIAGYNVNHLVAARLKEATGSEFLFVSGPRVFASTLKDRATKVLAGHLAGGGTPDRITDGVSEYVRLARDLIDAEGKPVGKLAILRSFEGAHQRVAEMRRDILLIWLAAITAGLVITWVLTRRIVRPIEKLDRAAAEVAHQNYDHHVEVESEDEIGRLASTFNTMCASIKAAQQELIRQERISTIGRLASSIVHDLRNPLAAIYGGAEMLVDTDLSEPQVKRVAANIYRASRRIQELLHDLTSVSRGKIEASEASRLQEVVAAAFENFGQAAESQSVKLHMDVAEEIELPLERSRMERVFGNLISNAIEAMPGGGEVSVKAHLDHGAVIVEVRDNGPGISREVRAQLFQPFVSVGKKNGLGLGLALSRQTVLDHGGDMWADSGAGRGACFYIRLPLDRAIVSAASQSASRGA